MSEHPVLLLTKCQDIHSLQAETDLASEFCTSYISVFIEMLIFLLAPRVEVCILAFWDIHTLEQSTTPVRKLDPQQCVCWTWKVQTGSTQWVLWTGVYCHLQLRSYLQTPYQWFKDRAGGAVSQPTLPLSPLPFVILTVSVSHPRVPLTDKASMLIRRRVACQPQKECRQWAFHWFSVSLRIPCYNQKKTCLDVVWKVTWTQ